MLTKLFRNQQVRKFRTNINCGKCIMAVTPFMDNVKGLKSWDVDLDAPNRILKVKGNFDTHELACALSEAGYTLGEELK